MAVKVRTVFPLNIFIMMMHGQKDLLYSMTAHKSKGTGEPFPYFKL